MISLVDLKKTTDNCFQLLNSHILVSELLLNLVEVLKINIEQLNVLLASAVK